MSSSNARVNKVDAVGHATLVGVVVFGHHSRVDLTYSSRYIYDVLQFLGDRLYDYFVMHKYHAENFINGVENWEYVGEIRVRGRKYFVFRNLGYCLEFYVRPSWMDDAPIIIRFDNETVTVKLIYKNTSDATVVYESSPKVSVQIDMYGSLDFVPLLQVISQLPNRDIDFRERLLWVRFVKFEIYVRYARKHLKKVERALLALRDRIGIGFELRDKLQFRGQYWIVVDAIYQGIPFKLKSYLSHKHRKRDPKLEFVLPLGLELRDIGDADKLAAFMAEVKRKVDFAREFLASFVAAINLELTPTDEDFKFHFYEVIPVEEYVAFVLGSSLSYELERLILDDPRLDDVDRSIVTELARGNLTSVDVSRIAIATGKAKRTIQYHLKRLEEWGYVKKMRKGRKNQWVYWLNLEKFVKPRQLAWEDYIDSAFKEVAVQKVIASASRSISRKQLHEFVVVLWLIYKGVNTVSAILLLLPKFDIAVSKRTVQYWLSQLVKWGLIVAHGKGRRRRYVLNFKP